LRLKFIPLFLLVYCLSFAAGYKVLGQDEETQYDACDNSGVKDTKTHSHNCDCDRASEMCDNEHPRSAEVSQKCKAGYCKPDKCDCTTESCSHT
jgi:hypothetical protein